MKKFALIVAGGAGLRMGAEVPKQFLELSGKPILMRTIERFVSYDSSVYVIVVLPSDQFERWQQLCRQHDFSIRHELVAGGNSRFQSVKNGLDQIPDDGLVFIHDGVRPLVSEQTIKRCENMAAVTGNALPVMPVLESLRQLDGSVSKHVDRSRFRLVQTPQTFQNKLIKQAYCQPESDLFTDDASVCEAFGVEIHLVDGNPENIKVTHPIDLLIAETLLGAIS